MINLLFCSQEEGWASCVGELSEPIDNLLKKRGEGAVVSRLLTKKNIKNRNVLPYLYDEQGDFYSKYNGVLIFCDDKLYDYLCSHVGLYFMIFNVGDIAEEGTVNNIQKIESLIAKSLKIFFFLKEVIDKNRVMMRLPYKNFSNPKIKAFFDSLRAIEKKDMGNIFSEIRKLKHICYKKDTSLSLKKIFVDSNNNNFIFGDERHARQATSEKDGHSMICDISSKYRFGHRIDDVLHFNVQKRKGNISGSFFNCHNEKEDINKKTHINMFTSDFMEY